MTLGLRRRGEDSYQSQISSRKKRVQQEFFHWLLDGKKNSNMDRRQTSMVLFVGKLSVCLCSPVSWIQKGNIRVVSPVSAQERDRGCNQATANQTRVPRGSGRTADDWPRLIHRRGSIVFVRWFCAGNISVCLSSMSLSIC